MQYFAIDTTTTKLKLALFNTKTQKCFKQEYEVGRKQSEQLHIKIKEFFEQANIKTKDIEKIVVNLGPGPYTNLRLGLAAAKGLSLPFSIPVIGVNSFDIIETLYTKEEKSSAIIIENNEQNLYLKTSDKLLSISPEELAEHIPATTKVFGSFMLYKDYLNNYDLVKNSFEFSALDLINYVIANNIDDSTLEPLYIKPLTYKKYEYKL